MCAPSILKMTLTRKVPSTSPQGICRTACITNQIRNPSMVQMPVEPALYRPMISHLRTTARNTSDATNVTVETIPSSGIVNASSTGGRLMAGSAKDANQAAPSAAETNSVSRTSPWRRDINSGNCRGFATSLSNGCGSLSSWTANAMRAAISTTKLASS